MNSLLSKSTGVATNTCHCYELVYNSVEGYSILLGRKLEHRAPDAEYYLRGCMYNTSIGGFIGRFHDSLPLHLVENLYSGAVICPINQASFFYSHNEVNSLVFVVELTAKYLYESKVRELCLGWTMFPIYSALDKPGKSVLHKTTVNAFRLALYEGTPRALFSLRPIIDNPSLVSIPGCILTISLKPHPTLARAVHLLPPSTLFSLEDIVPGLVPTKLHEAYPKLMKSISCTLEKLSLLLLPSVDDFEEQLLANLTDDLMTEGSGVDENSSISIEERRLKVAIFNGWRYVGSPVIGYLGKMAPSSKSYGLRSNLLLKGSLELSDLAAHPLLEIVLELEYVMSWKTNTATAPQSLKRDAKPLSVHTTPLTLGWAVFQPFNLNQGPVDEDSQQMVKQVSVELKSGPGFSPTIIPYSAHNVCYKSNFGDVGKVSFRFLPTRASSRIEESYASSVSNLVLEDTFTPSRSPLRRPRSRTPEPGKLAIPGEDAMLARPAHSTSTPIRRVHTDETDMRRTPPHELRTPPHERPLDHRTPPLGDTPLHHIPVEVRQGGERTPQHSSLTHSSIPRSTLAYFHQSGLEDFKDSKGRSIPQVTTPPELSSITDVLQHGPYQIAIQLLGFKFSGNSVSMATRSLRLELHFYHFPDVVLHSVLTPPPPQSSGLPHLLQDKSADSVSGDLSLAHWFRVHLESLPSRAERCRFTAFLQHGCMTADVYDGDSLILLGVARIPLASLIPPVDSRSESSFFQQCLACPAMDLDSGTSGSDLTSTAALHHGQALNSTCIGQLYLRLARLPPSSQDLDHHPKPDISRVNTYKQNSHVARRLYGGHTPWEEYEGKTEDEATRQRKLSRMHRVREAKLNRKNGDIPYGHMVSTLPSQSSIIDLQREELKRERINCVLQEAMTSHYLLRPLLGQALYLEHTFTNTFNHPLSVCLAWNDPDLKLVMDSQECEYLRDLHSINAVKDICTVTEGKNGGQYGFFVHPGESVTLPFKYQCFSASAGDDAFPVEEEGTKVPKKSIKVYLQASHRELVGVLELCVDPRPQRVDHVFHFYHPERTFLKKVIDIDTGHPLFKQDFGTERSKNSNGKIFACASDPEVNCEIHSIDNTASVYIKSQVQPSPAVRKFYVFIYRGGYQVSPQEIWQIIIHSAQKVSHCVTLGQSSSVKLAVRGDHTHRKVSCYSFSAPVMMVIAPSPFLLNAYSLHEVHISLKTLSSDPNTVLVSAVDTDKSQLHLLGQWMIAVAVQEPEITRAFQISLRAGDNKVNEKSITFTNSYSKKKEYLFSTDRPDILKLKNTSAKLQPQETSVLYLLFQPAPHSLDTSALVFINDSADQIEECFLIKIVYLDH